MSWMFSHRMKGKLYIACVRSGMLYGSETWPVKEEDACRLQRTEMQMVRWMGNVSDRRPSEERRNRLGIKSISGVIQQICLRWFGHIERMDNDNWVSKCRKFEVAGIYVSHIRALVAQWHKTTPPVTPNFVCKSALAINQSIPQPRSMTTPNQSALSHIRSLTNNSHPLAF